MNGEGVESYAEFLGLDSPLAGAAAAAAIGAARFPRRQRASVDKRLPFALPARGLLSGLDGSIRAAAYVLNRDPPILYCPAMTTRPLSTVAALSRRLTDRKVVFLLMPTWSFELPRVVAQIQRGVAWVADHGPQHEFIFLCNTEEEARLIRQVGGQAVFSNHNLMVSEEIFCPLVDTAVEFDAVYNARVDPKKRHYLDARIGRLLHVTSSIGDYPKWAERRFIARLQAMSPGHCIANPIVDGMPQRLSPQEVNRAYNRAAVGLCLSAREGAMYSSMEYLMAGLPIVSTPSIGGRDVFFHPDYCTVVEPEPEAIRRAVEELRDRAIPRGEIRRRTLEIVLDRRARLLEFLDALYRRVGSSEPAPVDWPFSGTGGLATFKPARRLAAEIAAL